MKFVWLTDIHLEFLTDQEVQLFFQKILDARTSGVFLTGDISITKNICHHLTLMAKMLSVPI
jgi:hypothetical protein